MKVAFFHHAGGDHYAFRAYTEPLEALGWEPVWYELPGHGDRFNEKFLTRIDRVMDDVWERVAPSLTGDFALFGNSMGSLIAWLLVHRLKAAGRPMPLHFFAASRMAPQAYPFNPGRTEPDPEAFWDMIRGYGGSSDFVDNPEFRSLFEPMLRADFAVLESYAPMDTPRLDIPATVLFGRDDRYGANERATWQELFSGGAEEHLFDGGHFFVYEQPDAVLGVMRDALRRQGKA